MSSKTTGERRCADELTETTRAPPAAARAGCRPVASAKWPRWLVANCDSQPSGVRVSGEAITPALLTRMCSGPSQSAANAATEARSARSRWPTWTLLLPVVAMMSSATRSPSARLRTARVTSAPARGQRAGGLDADAGGAAGDDGPAAGQVDAVDHLGGGRGGGERRDDAVWHGPSPCSVEPEGPPETYPEAPPDCHRRRRGAAVTAATPRPLRADAQRNRDRLLAAAVAAFSQRPGGHARRDRQGGGRRHRHALPALPDPGGAGRGRLPQRVGPALRRVGRTARATLPPDQAVRAWMDRFVDYLTTKRGMAGALRAVIASGGDPFAESRAHLLAAITPLLSPARRRRHPALRRRPARPAGRAQRRDPARSGRASRPTGCSTCCSTACAGDNPCRAAGVLARVARVLPAANDSTVDGNDWLDPRWRAGAEAWATERLAALGTAVTGPIEQTRVRPWSVSLRVPTAGGAFWFKANTYGCRYEAALASALGWWAPEAVLVPVAVDAGPGLAADRRRGPDPARDVAVAGRLGRAAGRVRGAATHPGRRGPTRWSRSACPTSARPGLPALLADLLDDPAVRADLGAERLAAIDRGGADRSRPGAPS